MKASDLKFDELFDIKEGIIDLKGRRLVLHSINAFAHLRKDLLKAMGEEQTKCILTRFGYYWGQADAAAMKRIFKWDNITEWIKAWVKLFGLEGVAKSNIEKLEYDDKTGDFEMSVIWHNSGEAEEHLAEIGKAKTPSCWMLTGYASGYLSFCLGKNIYFIEQKCVTCGDKECRIIGKSEEAWAELSKKISFYYQTEDIKSKVKNLTEELKQKNKELEKQSERLSVYESVKSDTFVEIHSKSYRNALELAMRVARFDSSVLITGETGTGKEVMARFIHKNSQRSNGPFVAINCGALPETLLESELFGHKAGAFTGAINDRIGLFEEAKGGTIFLDEIGDITPSMQLKLLRVLQEKEVIRLGENRPRKIDARVIAATNRNLIKDVTAGKFREDLYYRIKIIEIEIPPLRKRIEDILPLARFFIKRLAKKLNIPKLRLDSTCVDYLVEYNWPGNVRELENVLERAAVITPDGVIKPEHLPVSITHAGKDKTMFSDPLSITLAQLEERHIKTVLDLCGGNKTKAAKFLGISQATLWRKMKK